LWYGVCVFCCCWCALVLPVHKIRKFFDKALLWSIFYYLHSCFFKIVWCWRIRNQTFFVVIIEQFQWMNCTCTCLTKIGYKLYIKYESLIIFLYFGLHNENQI
jgi:hypothetical protein